MSLLELFLVVHFFLLHPAEEKTQRFDSFDMSYEVKISKDGIQAKGTNNNETHTISCVGWNYLELSQLRKAQDPFGHKPKLKLKISDSHNEKQKEIDLDEVRFGRITNHATNELIQFSLEGGSWDYAESDNAYHYIADASFNGHRKPSFVIFKAKKAEQAGAGQPATQPRQAKE
jgi:hypothetical protein